MNTADFKKRRELFEKKLAKDAEGRPFLALIHSGKPGKLDRFSPDPCFYYFTGVECQEASYLVFNDGKKSSEALFLPPSNPIKARWEGGELPSGALDTYGEPDAVRKKTMKETGFGTILSNYGIQEFLEKSLDMLSFVYLDFSGSAGCTCAFPYEFREKLSKARPNIVFKNVRDIVVSLRNVKDAFEVSKIRESIDIAIEAQDAIMEFLTPGLHEYEIEAIVKYIFTLRGGQGEAFATIIGAGKNSTVLHYNKNRKKIEKNDMVVCDLGVRKDYYCSDLTRTYPASGKFSKAQIKYYEIVLEAQELSFRKAKAGVAIADINKAVAELYKKKGVDKFNFHGVSHHLGIETHDGGTLDAPLQEGAVITIEPGLYYQKENIGVRIEDDILIRKNGCEVLSKELIKDIADIEKRMAKKRVKTIL